MKNVIGIIGTIIFAAVAIPILTIAALSLYYAEPFVRNLICSVLAVICFADMICLMILKGGKENE